MRFDPEAGAALEMRFEIEIVVEGAVALKQTKTARGLVKERRDAELFGVRKRPSDPFILPGVHQQSVRIMHLWPVIIDSTSLILAGKKHAGQRRNAKPLHVGAGKERGLHLNHGFCARSNVKAVGAGH
jgi:hypothetical protein